MQLGEDEAGDDHQRRDERCRLAVSELTEAERQYFQSIVMQLHSQFVRAVAEGETERSPQAEVAKIADGRVFTGEEALPLKLVDKLGTSTTP